MSVTYTFYMFNLSCVLMLSDNVSHSVYTFKYTTLALQKVTYHSSQLAVCSHSLHHHKKWHKYKWTMMQVWTLEMKYWTIISVQLSSYANSKRRASGNRTFNSNQMRTYVHGVIMITAHQQHFRWLNFYYELLSVVNLWLKKCAWKSNQFGATYPQKEHLRQSPVAWQLRCM